MSHIPTSSVAVWMVGCCVLCLDRRVGEAQQPSVDNRASVESLWTRSGTDWPTFLGPLQNGKSPESGIITDWSEGKLKRIWSQPLGEGYGMGSVALGRYVVMDRVNTEERVRCFAAETGQPLWIHTYRTTYTDSYGMGDGPRATPVIDGNRVYTLGVEGWLYCLDIRDGRVIWKVDTNTKFGVVQNFFGVASTPVVAGDLLIVMVGGSPQEFKRLPVSQLDRVRPNGSGIVAFDKRTGETRYQVADELASYASLVIAELAGERVGLAFCRGSLVAFDPPTGNIRAQHAYRSRRFESVNASTPIVAGNKVFISEDYGLGGTLLKFHGDSFEVLWTDVGRRDKAMNTHWNTPVLVDGYLYGCAGHANSDSVLRCTHFETGEIRWSVPRLSRSSVTFIDGHLLCMTERGDLLLVKASPDGFEQVASLEDTGLDPFGSYPFEAPCWAAPMVSRGFLYVRDRYRLYCFELIPQS